MVAPNASQSAFAFFMAFSLKLTALLACAWLMVFALRRASSALRHHVWTAAVLGSLVLPLLIALLPAWHSTTLGTAAAVLTADRANAPSAAAPAIPAIIVNAVSSRALFGRFAAAVLLVWLLGFTTILARLLVGLARLAWISAHSRPLFEDVWMREALNLSTSFKISRPVRLLESCNPLAMPLTCGFFRPLILLPAGAT